MTDNIRILQLPLGPLQTNCYVLADTIEKQVAVIDPAWDGRAIAAKVTEEGWEINHILLTHSHFDHVGGLAELKEVVDAPVYAHPEAVPMLQQAQRAAALWQIPIIQPPSPEETLHEGQIIRVGRLEISVLYTPGHAPGHVCFYLPDHNVLFDGDVLFQQGIGRTDLPGGDYDLLMQSIHEKLLVLPDETLVLSGHGGATTIGLERRGNPFLLE